MFSEDSIRIATGATSIRHLMSDAVVEFRFRNPKVDLEFLTASSSQECIAALAAGRADLAWVTISDPVDGIEQRPVLELPWALAVRVGEIYSDRAWVEVPELSGLRLVRLPEGSISGGKLAAALADVTLGADAGTADWDTALLLAELGVGHTIVPQLPSNRQAGDGLVRLIPLRGIPPLSVGWAAVSWDELSASARAFTNVLRIRRRTGRSRS